MYHVFHLQSTISYSKAKQRQLRYKIIAQINLAVNYRTLILTCFVDNQYLPPQFLHKNINKSIKTNRQKLFICEGLLRKTATIILKVLDSKQRLFSPSIIWPHWLGNFFVLTHTLELHTKNHVNILGSQKKIQNVFNV